MTDVAERSKRDMNDAGTLSAQRCESTAGGASADGDSEASAEDPQILELTHALASRDRFLSLIGHELRNTLAPMMLLAEQFGTLAEGSQPPGKVLARVGMLTNNLNKLMATIGRIVEVADLRRGKVQLAPSTINLADVVREVCGEHAREVAAGGGELAIEAAEPVIGRWDRARVKEIASNLMDNAIRYGGGSRVEIAVRNGDGDAELVVRDRGPGIDAAVMPHLFGFFEHPTRQRPGGLGLGLWIVQTLCVAMGGAVSAENCSDGGARFCVVLPRG